MTTFKVRGSHGELDVNPKTGLVVNKYLDDDEYKNIERFDVDEYNKFLKDNYITDRDIMTGVDILDIGYWECKLYEKPLYDHRNLVHGVDKTQQEDIVDYFGRVDSLLGSYYGIGINDVSPTIVDNAYEYNQSPREIVLEIGERFGLDRI